MYITGQPGPPMVVARTVEKTHAPPPSRPDPRFDPPTPHGSAESKRAGGVVPAPSMKAVPTSHQPPKKAAVASRKNGAGGGGGGGGERHEVAEEKHMVSVA